MKSPKYWRFLPMLSNLMVDRTLRKSLPTQELPSSVLRSPDWHRLCSLLARPWNVVGLGDWTRSSYAKKRHMPRSTLEIKQVAQDYLQRNAHAALRDVFCECDQGVLVLRGRVLDFYYKQFAQAAVAHVAGVVQVVNEIQVIG
jgi:hypothetical protein